MKVRHGLKKDSRRNTWGYIKEDDIYVYSPFYGAAGGGVRDYFYFIDELNQNGTEMTFQLAQIDCFVYNDPIVYDQWGVNVRSKDVPQLDASNTTYRELVNALPDSFARFELKLNKKDEGYEFISCQRLTPVPQLKMTDENYYTVYRDGIQFNISGNQAASINDEIRRNSDLALVKEDENMLELRTYHIYTSDQEFVQSKWLEKYFAQEIVYLLNKQTLEITRQ